MKRYTSLNEVSNLGESFTLVPNSFNKSVYYERTDRNLGWITEREQEILQLSTVAIAGCGGMGGLLAAILLRAGVGHIKIADLEVFDISNLNRQFAANQNSIGLPKVIETARMLRSITEDTQISVYPDGISPTTITSFLEDASVICDEIEFWAVGARLRLHQHLKKGAVIFNANSVGMGTRLFRFTAQSQYKMRDILGIDPVEADQLESLSQKSPDVRQRILSSIIKGLVPELPEYMFHTELFSNRSEVHRRLFDEGRAPILASNPPMATGFLANHIILEILRQKSPLHRNVEYPPDMPGYLYFDAALMSAKVYRGIWWT